MEKIIRLCQDTYDKCFAFLKPQRPNEYENIELANTSTEEDERPEKNFFSDWKNNSSQPEDDNSSPKEARVVMNKKSNTVEHKENLIKKGEEEVCEVHIMRS